MRDANDQIESLDMMIALPSMVIAVGILSFPAILAQSTKFIDGWISILLGGFITLCFTWVIAKLAVQFPHQSFLSYASQLASKPVAYFFTILFILHGILLTAYEVSMISAVSYQYLFEQTPYEVVALAFFLVMIYAVSGSRSGIMRINILILPLIFFITGALIFFSLGFMEFRNVLPLFTTDFKGYVQGTIDSGLAFSGIGILFFYISFVKDPENVPRRAVFGMSWVVILYLLIYFTCIAVFGYAATQIIQYPFIELAQAVEIPGGFFERMEAIFFVIWLTAIFTTTMMAFDVTVLALQWIFPKHNKQTFVLILPPVIFFIAMIPKNHLDAMKFAKFVGFTAWLLPVLVVVILWILYGVRRRLKSEI